MAEQQDTKTSRPSWWRPLVGIDVRSLAALRIGLALVVLYDLATRLADLEAHYADTGVLPRADLLSWKEGTYHFSIHMMSGVWWFQGALFALAAVAALFMLVGRHTRVATFLTWFLLASLHNRNPLILHGGDQILRVMLFWCMFVPLGRAGSVDAMLRRSQSAGPRLVTSFATLALKLQLCGMYWTSAALKWHPVWTEEGTAVLMAMKLDQLVTPFGRFLTNFPEMLKFATFSTMYLETLGPLLAFSPILTAPLQMFVVVLFAGFHLVGLAPALYLGTFPWVCAACWMLFIPAAFWDRWSLNLPGRGRALAFGRTVGRSWIQLWHDQESTGLEVGGNRRRRVHWVTQSFVALLLVYVILWNVRTVKFDEVEKVFPRSLNFIAQTLHIGQLWNLFAPFPATEDGWFVFAGTMAGGHRMEILNGGEVTFDKPANVSKSLGRKRWTKYMMNLGERQYGIHRRLYGNYLCEQWNKTRTGDDRLASIQMFMVRERTLQTGEEQEPVPGVLWNQVCVLEEPADTSE